MWLEEYNDLMGSEKDKFKKITNYLLNKTYLLLEIYEKKDKIGMINSDYRFVERYIDIFKEFFNLAGYDVIKDDHKGIIYIESQYNNNTLRLDKFTTLFLLITRTIYDEELEKNANKNVVFVQVSDLLYRLMEEKLYDKKPTLKETGECLRLLARYNIVAKYSGQFEERDCQIVIYPTITKIVSNEKITAIYNTMFKELDKPEQFDFENNEEVNA